MDIPLFDCNATLGLLRGKPAEACGTVETLLAEMDRLNISSALVWHSHALQTHPEDGNRELIEELGQGQGQGQEQEQGCRLHPVWTLLPDTGGDVPPLCETLTEMHAAGARTARIFPKAMKWSTAEWCSGPFFSQLEERRISVQIPIGEIGFDALHELLKAHPELPVVLCSIGYRENRILFPLLQQHPNLYLDLGPRNSVHNLIPYFCSKFGAGRLLFSTGWPHHEAGAGITYLMYAGISDEAKRQIGFENLNGLLEAVQW